MISEFNLGDIVQHPEKGYGIIVELRQGTCVADPPSSAVVYLSPCDGYGHNFDLTGWERVETVRPGYVQVRVDDLDLSRWPTDEQSIDTDDELVVIRAAKAKVAQRADERPHSRACGIRRHPHGPECHTNCPTCYPLPAW